MGSTEPEGTRAAVTADAAASDAAAHASSASSDADAHGVSLRGRTVMIVLLLAGNVLVSLMQSLLNVALDYVSAQFHVGLSEANLLILCYAIVAGTVITMAASLLKRYGLRRVICAALAFAFAGSLLGAFAWDFPSLLAARLIQAVATGLFFPIVNEALLVLSPKGHAGVLLAVNSGTIGFGLAVAPIVSGLVITYWGLQILFLIPAVMAALLFVASLFILHDIIPRERRPIDALSVAMSFVGLGAFMVGLNGVAHDPIPMAILMAAGAGVVALFIWRQGRIPHPLLDMSPFRNRAYSLGETLIILSYLSSMFLNLLIPLYLEGVAGYTPFIAGCLVAPPIVCYAAFCLLSGRILGKHGVWPLIPLGFAITLASFAVLAVTTRLDLIVGTIVGMAFAYASIGLAYPAIKSVDLEVLTPAQSSSGSSIHSTLVQVASSISSALFVGIMSGRVDSAMAHGASKAAAYGDGMGVTLWIALALLVVAVCLSVVYARRIQRTSAGA